MRHFAHCIPLSVRIPLIDVHLLIDWVDPRAKLRQYAEARWRKHDARFVVDGIYFQKRLEPRRTVIDRHLIAVHIQAGAIEPYLSDRGLLPAVIGARHVDYPVFHIGPPRLGGNNVNYLIYCLAAFVDFVEHPYLPIYVLDRFQRRRMIIAGVVPDRDRQIRHIHAVERYVFVEFKLPQHQPSRWTGDTLDPLHEKVVRGLGLHAQYFGVIGPARI